MPGLCTMCGRSLCEHTAEERGLTDDQLKNERKRDSTDEECEVSESSDVFDRIRAARIVVSRLYQQTRLLPKGGQRVVNGNVQA